MANTYSLDLELSSSQYASDTSPSANLNISAGLTNWGWVKFESLADGEQQCVSHRDTGTSYFPYGFLLSVTSGVGTLMFRHRNTSNETETASVAWTPTVATWYFVAVTVSGSTVKFYVGTVSSIPAQQGSNQTLSYTRTAAGSPIFFLGSSTGSASFFDGLLDDWRVYNAALTDFSGYKTEAVGNEANLQGYWKLNNDYTDSTANDTDLTASGSPVFSTDVPFVGAVKKSGLFSKFW